MQVYLAICITTVCSDNVYIVRLHHIVNLQEIVCPNSTDSQACRNNIAMENNPRFISPAFAADE